MVEISNGNGTWASSTVNFYLYPVLQPGIYDIDVYLNNVSIMHKANAFTVYADPHPASYGSITPDSCMRGQSITADFYGINARFDCYGGPLHTVTLTQGSFSIPSLIQNIYNTSYIFCIFQVPFTAPTGYYDVVTYDEMNGLLSKPNAFKILPNPHMPMAVSLVPNQVAQGVPVTIKVNSRYTVHSNPSLFSYPEVKFRKSSSPNMGYELHYGYSSGCTIWSDSALKVSTTIPYSAPAGTYDVISYDGMNGEIVYPAALTILPGQHPPSIQSITPDTVYGSYTSGALVFSETLTVKGKNTHFFNYNNWQQANFMGNNLTLYKSNDSIMTMILPNPYLLTSGWKQVEFSNAFDGTFLIDSAFYIYNPNIGIEDKTTSAFNIYPDPANDYLCIQTKSDLRKQARIQIFSTTGTIIKSETTTFQNNHITLQISDLPTGIYFVRVISPDQVYTGKFVKR